MEENIPKIIERVKGKQLVISKNNMFKMILEIDGVSAVGKFVHVDVLLKEYFLVVEQDNREIIIDGKIEFNKDSIVNIHNAAIRKELHNTLKHYGVEEFAYELKNVIF
jgi:hypothetical protein